ncbi:unnamed protein product, partial [Brassica oleracea]
MAEGQDSLFNVLPAVVEEHVNNASQRYGRGFRGLKVRPTSRSDYTGPVLLGFYYYWAFGLLSFYRFYRYRASRPLGFYRLCYFVFRTLGLCRTLCF